MKPVAGTGFKTLPMPAARAEIGLHRTRLWCPLIAGSGCDCHHGRIACSDDGESCVGPVCLGMPWTGRYALMNKPSAESGPIAFGLPLTRRRAFTRAGAGLAALGLGAASGRPSPLLAQEPSPSADEPAPVDAPGIVTPQRAAHAVERLPELAETILRQSGVPGMSVAVVHDDAIPFSGGFGVRE